MSVMDEPDLSPKWSRPKLRLSRATDAEHRILVRDAAGDRVYRRLGAVENTDRIVEIAPGFGLLGDGKRIPLGPFRVK